MLLACKQDFEETLAQHRRLAVGESDLPGRRIDKRDRGIPLVAVRQIAEFFRKRRQAIRAGGRQFPADTGAESFRQIAAAPQEDFLLSQMCRSGGIRGDSCDERPLARNARKILFPMPKASASPPRPGFEDLPALRVVAHPDDEIRMTAISRWQKADVGFGPTKSPWVAWMKRGRPAEGFEGAAHRRRRREVSLQGSGRRLSHKIVYPTATRKMLRCQAVVLA